MSVILSLAAVTDNSWEVPSTWKPVSSQDQSRIDVVVVCPACGRYHMLDHRISPVGEVRPTVVCPYPGCDFRDDVVLNGWSEYWEENDQRL